MSSMGNYVRDRWFASRVYLAWSNRCVRCLIDPHHGDDSC
jgi:hypothetical protein